jgi:hypothetical protein
MWGHLVEVECDAYPGHPSSSYYKKPGNFSRYGEAESSDGTQLEVLRTLDQEAGLAQIN